MYVIEMWDADGENRRLERTTRVCVYKVDQYGLSTLFHGVNEWQEGDDERN